MQHHSTEYIETVFFFFKLSLKSAVSKMIIDLRKTLWLRMTTFFYSHFLSVIHIYIVYLALFTTVKNQFLLL